MSKEFEAAYDECLSGVADTIFNSTLDKYEQDSLFEMLHDDLSTLLFTQASIERNWVLKLNAMGQAMSLLGEAQ